MLIHRCRVGGAVGLVIVVALAGLSPAQSAEVTLKGSTKTDRARAASRMA